MLKPNFNQYPQMTAEERREFEQALAQEHAAKERNIEEARAILPRLLADCEQSAEIVRQLRTAREAAGVSLAELEQRTGIRKSVLSRLENSKAPNPTLSTLQRYGEALGKRVVFSIEDEHGRIEMPRSGAGDLDACLLPINDSASDQTRPIEVHDQTRPH
jgi:transcriptional regulator with XRE-family HTH domain